MKTTTENVPQRRPSAALASLFGSTEDAPAEHAPPAEVPVRVTVAELVLEDRIQPREKMDPAWSRELAELLREASVEGKDTATVYQDPLIVYVDVDGTKRVAEGFHRTDGARLSLVTTELMAILRPGGITEARLWAAGTNDAHGRLRHKGDLRRVLLWFLDDPSGKVTLTPELLQRLPEESRAKVPVGKPIVASDHLIAALCRCAQSTVSRLKADLKRERAAGGTATDPAHQLHLGAPPAEREKRLGLDGKERRLPQRPPHPEPVVERDEDDEAPPPRRVFKEDLFPPAKEVPERPPVAGEAFAEASKSLKLWRRLSEHAGLTPKLMMRLLLREAAQCHVLRGHNARLIERLVQQPEDDEVLLHPYEEQALFFALHNNGVKWAYLQAQGADDGELLQAVQQGLGQRGAHSGEKLRVEWKGGRSPEVRLIRVGSKHPPTVLQGQDLLSAVRSSMQIPGAGRTRAQ